MPGYKGMKQDRRPVDGQDTLQTMQDKKMMQPRQSGIYMDRTEGKLPQDRVAKYYQETNPKMEQGNFLKATYDHLTNPEASEVGKLIKGTKDAVKGSSLYKTLKGTYNYLSGGSEDQANKAQAKYRKQVKEIVARGQEINKPS
tara:strand:+ start:4171 stop:4599 length:429 start_codon:yes stop_codon:yes gene_type:complete